MPIDPAAVRGLVFDYGNTLIPFGVEQIERCDRALSDALEQHFGSIDQVALQEIRHRNRMAPYTGDPPAYCENDFRAITREMIEELYGHAPENGLIDAILEVRHQIFLEVIEAPDYLPELLTKLAQRYQLALLSNYPDGVAIRASMDRIGLRGFFEPIVVSGDLGYCKPHPMLFENVTGLMGLAPEECLFVGDNWLADVQGAKAAGMQVVHTTQWNPPEQFERREEDHAPDAVIGHFTELEALLLEME
jgi:putative hydrolase of the HAD superfamily